MVLKTYLPLYLAYMYFSFLLKPDSYGALGSSDVVILLHGFPTSSFDWNKVTTARLVANQHTTGKNVGSFWAPLLCEAARNQMCVVFFPT